MLPPQSNPEEKHTYFEEGRNRISSFLLCSRVSRREERGPRKIPPLCSTGERGGAVIEEKSKTRKEIERKRNCGKEKRSRISSSP